MKKHFLLGLLSGALFAAAGVFVAGQAWSELEPAPFETHYVVLDTSKPAGVTACEVYTALGVAERILFATDADAQGHLPGCMLRVTGHPVAATGDFQTEMRPGNPLSIAEWQATKRFGTIKKQNIVGVCRETEYMGTAQTDSCKKALDFKNSIRDAATGGTSATAKAVVNAFKRS